MATCNPNSMSPVACDPRKNVRPQVTPMPPIPAIINCLRHQAPRGWRYVQQGGVCVLQNRVTGVISTQPGIAITPVIVSGAGNTVAGTLSGVTNWIQNNKGLALAIAIFGYVVVKGNK